MIKIGMIGTGFIADFQLKALLSVRGAEVVGVYSASQERGSEFSNKVREMGLGPCTAFSSVESLCEKVDVVAVFNENHLRVATFEKVAEAVRSTTVRLKGIICEKPLGRNIGEAKTIVKLVEEMGVPSAYFENQIFMPAINNGLYQLRPAIRSSGNLFTARSAEEHAGPHRPWFWNPVLQGGGVLSDMGCHSIAVCRHMLTPPDKAPDFLRPTSMSARTSLMKWGTEPNRGKLKKLHGVDYAITPAEDHATGTITFTNPETGQTLEAQFTNSWMFDRIGLRLSMEGLGAGYAMNVDTLTSPASIFIGDSVAEAVSDAEQALEKGQTSRGHLVVHPDEASLYGYVEEWRDAIRSFEHGRDGFLNLAYGLEITRLVAGCYLSAELGRVITPNEVSDDFVSLIAQGRGAEVLYKATT